MKNGSENVGNGYQNLGIIQKWLKTITPKLSPIDKSVLLELAEQSVGYKRATTNRPSEYGHNYNSQKWADSLGISKPTFLKSLKSLTTLGLIKVHKGSLYRADGGSYPDYYQILFDKELFIKNKWFISLDTTKNNKKSEQASNASNGPTVPDIILSLYMMLPNGKIYRRYKDDTRKDTGDEYKDAAMDEKVISDVTSEQLLKHLENIMIIRS